MDENHLQIIGLVLTLLGFASLFLWLALEQPINVSIERLNADFIGKSIELTAQVKEFSLAPNQRTVFMVLSNPDDAPEKNIQAVLFNPTLDELAQIKSGKINVVGVVEKYDKKLELVIHELN